MLSENQKHLIDLDAKKPEIKRYYEDLEKILKEVIGEIGIDGHFQDEVDGTVFQIIKSKGKYITFNEFEYVRTKRKDEKSGTLSLKKAKEFGYEV